MDDLRKLTRIILIGLGVYILIFTSLLVVSDICLLFSREPLPAAALVSVFVNLAITALIIYLLLSKADFFAERVVGREAPVRRDVDWLPFAFRLTSVFAGILYAYWLVPWIISDVGRYVVSRQSRLSSIDLTWDCVAGWVIQLGLAIYLLCGAPHFVRWQVKKTLEHCSRQAQAGCVSEQKPD